MDKNDIVRLTEGQNSWRGSQCLNMIASENVMSPLAHSLYASDFMHRYAEGTPFKRYYQGTRYIDELEEGAIGLAKELFRAKQADLRVISGGAANLAAFSALAGYGELLLSPGVVGGSHISHEAFGVAGVLGLKTDHAVFDQKEYNLDVDASVRKILQLKPKLVTLGGSVILFPHPVREFRQACDEIGAKLLYDGAHVLGLIAGGKFQDPLGEGAEILTASTHKTFPGPQGGVILGNTDEKTWKHVQFRVFPGVISNHHLHRIPAMAVTMLEMREFGRAYAEQTVRNAKALGQAMHELGFGVLANHRGFTESHQILVDVRKEGGGKHVATALEQADIIVNKNILAWDDVNSADNPSGLRIGVQELTRKGMKESEMRHIARLMKKVVMDRQAPDAVKGEVAELNRDFRKVRFCLG